MQRNINFFYFINSFSYITIGFLSVFLLSRFAMGGTGFMFDIPSVLYKHGLQFAAQEEDWWYDSVIAVFSSRVISYIFLGLVMYVIYLKAIPYKGYLKLYFIWASFIAFTLLIGEIFFGNILKEGVYHALAWLYVGQTFRLIMIISMMMMYLLMGIMYGKALVLSANIYFVKFDENRLQRFFLYQVFYPYLAFVVIFTLLMLPEFPVILLVSLYTGIIVLFIVLFHSGKHAKFMNSDEEPEPVMFDYKAFLTALSLTIFYVVFLSGGILLS